MQVGGQHCNVDIVITYSEIWLARVHLEDPLIVRLEVREYVAQSEVATLRFLERMNFPTLDDYTRRIWCVVHAHASIS